MMVPSGHWEDPTWALALGSGWALHGLINLGFAALRAADSANMSRSKVFLREAMEQSSLPQLDLRWPSQPSSP